MLRQECTQTQEQPEGLCISTTHTHTHPQQHPQHTHRKSKRACLWAQHTPHTHTTPFPHHFVCVSCSVSRVCLFAIPWTVAHQAPLPMEFSRQEYWSGWPFPSLRSLPNPGIKPASPALQADSLPAEPPGKPHYSAQRV